jgi:hypothetical protein
MVAQSEWDVVYPPFMLRVRAAVGGAGGGAPRLRPSSLRGIAAATDEWFALRCRCEQVVAEANAMLTAATAPLDLDDEFGTGQLAFVVRCGDRSARVSLTRTGRQAWVELERSYAPSHRPAEPEDLGTLEDLLVELLVGTGVGSGEPDGGVSEEAR